jgi:hypothetical protein
LENQIGKGTMESKDLSKLTVVSKKNASQKAKTHRKELSNMNITDKSVNFFEYATNRKLN